MHVRLRARVRAGLHGAVCERARAHACREQRGAQPCRPFDRDGGVACDFATTSLSVAFACRSSNNCSDHRRRLLCAATLHAARPNIARCNVARLPLERRLGRLERLNLHANPPSPFHAVRTPAAAAPPSCSDRARARVRARAGGGAGRGGAGLTWFFCSVTKLDSRTSCSSRSAASSSSCAAHRTAAPLRLTHGRGRSAGAKPALPRRTRDSA